MRSTKIDIFSSSSTIVKIATFSALFSHAVTARETLRIDPDDPYALFSFESVGKRNYSGEYPLVQADCLFIDEFSVNSI